MKNHKILILLLLASGVSNSLFGAKGGAHMAEIRKARAAAAAAAEKLAKGTKTLEKDKATVEAELAASEAAKAALEATIAATGTGASMEDFGPATSADEAFEDDGEAADKLEKELIGLPSFGALKGSVRVVLPKAGTGAVPLEDDLAEGEDDAVTDDDHARAEAAIAAASSAPVRLDLDALYSESSRPAGDPFAGISTAGPLPTDAAIRAANLAAGRISEERLEEGRMAIARAAREEAAREEAAREEAPYARMYPPMPESSRSGAAVAAGNPFEVEANWAPVAEARAAEAAARLPIETQPARTAAEVAAAALAAAGLDDDTL